jgi:hypothetical protein
MAWYNIQTASDCITPTEWNNMTQYIQHSACTDFTIYGTCPSTGAVFKFGGNNDIEFDGDRAIMIDNDETYIGHGAGDSITSGLDNTFLGYNAGNAITTGSYNVALGYTAAGNTAVGVTHNLVMGFQAGLNNIASNIIAIGSEAGKNNTQAYVIGIGSQALLSNTGEANIAIGYQSSKAALSGDYNIAIGHQTLQNATSANSNVAIGYQALLDNVTGDQNVAIGALAGENALVSGCVYIGYDAGSDNATANRLYINNSNSSDPLILGEFDNGVVDIHDVLRMEKRNADYTPPNNHGAIWVSDGTGTGDDGDLIYAYTDGVGATTTIIIGNIA